MRGIFILGMMIGSLLGFAQKGADHIKQGNAYYKEAQYDLAEAQYRLAIQKEPQSGTAYFNLANALIKQKKFDEATRILNTIATTPDKAKKSVVFYNTGVIYTKEKELDSSITMYKNALRYNPDDQQARENLERALMEKNQQQNQQNNQKQQSNLSQKQAEQKLKQLEEREKQLKERLQGQNSRSTANSSQDW